MRILILSIVIAGSLLGSGCRAEPNVSDSPTVKASSPESPSPTMEGAFMTAPASTPTSPDLQTLIERTREDLSSRLSVPPTEISLVETNEVEWSDSSLDCPQPDMAYLQVITPGYRIVFQINDQRYEYHTDRNTNFVYCTDGISPLLPKP